VLPQRWLFCRPISSTLAPRVVLFTRRASSLLCRSFVKANILQLVVITNHQNGRDTHLRQIKVFGPRTDLVAALGHPMTFTTTELLMYATVR
jgi:hypothetical protein